MAGSVAETIDEYNQKVRTDIEPVDAYPKTVDERNAELALWTRKLEYQQVSNDKLQLQLDFFKKLMDYICEYLGDSGVDLLEEHDEYKGTPDGITSDAYRLVQRLFWNTKVTVDKNVRPMEVTVV